MAEKLDLDRIADEATALARNLSNALESARTIRDLAQAASSRGLRDNDVAEFSRQANFLDTFLALAKSAYEDLKPLGLHGPGVPPETLANSAHYGLPAGVIYSAAHNGPVWACVLGHDKATPADGYLDGKPACNEHIARLKTGIRFGDIDGDGDI